MTLKNIFSAMVIIFVTLTFLLAAYDINNDQETELQRYEHSHEIQALDPQNEKP